MTAKTKADSASAVAEIEASEQDCRLEQLTAQVPALIYQYQQWPDGRVALPFASARLRDVYGIDPEDVRRDATLVFSLLDSRDCARVRASIADSAATLSTWQDCYRVQLPGRGTLWIEGEAAPERLADGSTLWSGSMRDVTARMQREELRKAQQAEVELAAEVFSSSAEGIIVCDKDTRILQVNEGFQRITGYSREEALGCTPRLLASGRHDPAFYQQMWESVAQTGSWRGEIWNRRASGEVYAELLSISVVRDEYGEVRNYIGVFSDIAPIKNYERELKRMANYDHLTGVPNRRLLSDRLDVAIRRTRRDGSVLAVCYLDLDGFKPINDRFGHEVGDQILISLTRRLKQAIRGEETLARIGGDEFVLLFNAVSNRPTLARLLNRILELIREPIEYDGALHRLTASIGVSLSPPDEADPEILIRHADQAMYCAKDAGRDCIAFYDQDRDTERQALQRRRRLSRQPKSS